MGKYGRYKKKYKTCWEQEGWARGWLKEASDQQQNSYLNEAYCTVCKVSLRAHRTDLLKHKGTRKHKVNFEKIAPSSTQGNLNKFVVANISNDEKKRDMKFAAYIACHSAIRSIDHLNQVLIDTCKIDCQMHRTKCSGVIKNVISPTLFEELLEDLGNMPFSLIVDESTDKSTQKYLCLCIKYFSNIANKIISNFLCMLYMENGTADHLYNCIKNYCNSNKINLSNLIGIGTDGANSLCGKNHSLFTLLKENTQNQQLILVRCVCHSLNNASSNAAECLPASVEFLCREIFNWFQNSPNRKVQYQETWDLININEDRTFHQFVQLTKTRWLSRYNVIRVLLEHWLELKTHFSGILDKEKCYTARILSEMLNDNTNYAFLLIIKPILYEVNKLNLIFQKNDLEIGQAYVDLCNIIIVIAKKIMKPIFLLNNDVNTIFSNIENDLAFLLPNKCDYGHDYFSSVILATEQKQVVEDRAFKYLKALLTELLKRLPDTLNLFKSLQNLSPQLCLNQRKAKFKDLPFTNIFIKKDDISKCEIQWDKLLAVNWTQIFGENITENSYTFWPSVLKYTDAGCNYAFPELATYVITCLTLPTSNATVERAFSIMNAIKTKPRNKMHHKMLDSLMRIKIDFYSKGTCCQTFEPSEKMFQKFKSKNIYDVDQESNTNTEQFIEMIGSLL